MLKSIKLEGIKGSVKVLKQIRTSSSVEGAFMTNHLIQI